VFYWTCRVPSIHLAQHQINPVSALSSYFLMIYFNNILPPIPKSSQRPFSTRYPATILCPFLFYTSHVIFPAHFIFLHFISLKTLNYTPAVHWTHLTQLPWSSLSSQKAKLYTHSPLNSPDSIIMEQPVFTESKIIHLQFIELTWLNYHGAACLHRKQNTADGHAALLSDISFNLFILNTLAFLDSSLKSAACMQKKGMQHEQGCM